MAEQEVVGTIWLTVNGREFDCTGFSPTENAGRKPVSTMNRQGRVRRWARTTRGYSLSFEVVVPEHDSFDFASVEDATLTIESLDGGKRTTYTGVGVEEVGEQYQDGNEAKRSIKAFALDKVEE